MHRSNLFEKQKQFLGRLHVGGLGHVAEKSNPSKQAMEPESNQFWMIGAGWSQTFSDGGVETEPEISFPVPQP